MPISRIRGLKYFVLSATVILVGAVSDNVEKPTRNDVGGTAGRIVAG
jgi:hypothetical protein